MRAAWFAAERHSTQKRKGAAQEPYINHLLEVASLLSETAAVEDTDLVIAALLHDTVEDTGVSADEISGMFGEDVATIVLEVTDDKSLPKAQRKELQVQNAPHKSERARNLKVADKISNVRAILESPPAGWDAARRREYFLWADRVVTACGEVHPALRAEFTRLMEKLPDLG